MARFPPSAWTENVTTDGPGATLVTKSVPGTQKVTIDAGGPTVVTKAGAIA